MTATGYQPRGWSAPHPIVSEAAGNLYSTVTDMGRWVAASMPGPNGAPAGGGILTPHTLALMYAPPPDAQGAGDVYYALGHDVEILPNGGAHMISHNGTIVGWRASFSFIPDRAEGLVVLQNNNNKFFLLETTCEWSQWAAGDAPRACQTYQRLDAILSAAALLLGVGVILAIWRLVVQIRSGKKRLIWPLQKLTRKQLFNIVLPLVSIAIWWFVVTPPFGAFLPPTPLLILAIVVTLWCSREAVTGFVVKVN